MLSPVWPVGSAWSSKAWRRVVLSNLTCDLPCVAVGAPRQKDHVLSCREKSRVNPKQVLLPPAPRSLRWGWQLLPTGTSWLAVQSGSEPVARVRVTAG